MKRQSKMLYFHLLGTLAITICMAQEIRPTPDISLETTNNRRIIHNAADDQRTQTRGKRLRQATDKTTTPAPDDDEDKKTLAQQVADGKYGLIQTELFASPAERPGIISYEANPEVPKDNVNNLGGLQPEEIWLAENHLLVLRGGSFSENDQNTKTWPPIDNYIAPLRQVKIPPNPKVPPPFPVQLKEGGPIEFIKGKNGTTGGPSYFDPRFEPHPYFPPLNYPIGEQGNFTEGNGGTRLAPLPFLPPPPGIGSYPPAAAFLPPPGNFTELDEDDPTIYYPPPYDFFYPKDNSSHVPPGPLVPGIILPPPPNFFSAYENKTSQKQTQLNSYLRKPPTKSRLPPQYIQSRPTIRPPTSTHQPTKSFVTTTIESITTARPTLITTTDNIPNEIPSRTLPQNTPVGDWIPIPAPRPFYITEIKNLKSVTKGTHNNRLKDKFNYPPRDWLYENTTKYEPHTGNEQTLTEGWTRDVEYTTPHKKGRHQTSTENPFSEYTPIYISKPIDTTTILPPVGNQYIPAYNTEKPAKGYYYYDDPRIPNKNVNQGANDYNRPAAGLQQDKFYDFRGKNNYESNTLTPTNVYGDVATITTPPTSSKSTLQNGNFYDPTYHEAVSTTPAPINYYYYNRHPKQHQGQNYAYESPISIQLNSYNPQELEIIARPDSKKPSNPQTRTTTEKPPVYEYSYSAPGYGTIEAPKVGVNFATTPKSLLYESNFTPVRENPYNYFNYQNTPAPPQYTYEQRQPPQSQYFTTSRPSYDGHGKYQNIGVYPQPPRNIHSQEVVLDDITKKYFALFGQKLNSESLNDAVTTPLPPVLQNQYYNNYANGVPTTTEENKHVKFPDDIYELQNEQPFYSRSHPKGYYQQYKQPNRVQSKPVGPNSGYPNYYRLSSPENEQYRNYDGVQPGHSLLTDVNVNLKKPQGPLEPDAEFIDPAYVTSPSGGNSFISYQLPGSGGHFYFLTPQAVKPPPQVSYSRGYPQYSGYFKRNAQSKPRLQLNTRKART